MNVEPLEKLGACRDAIKWARTYPSRQKAWDACERGDWMLWILGKTCKPNSPQHRKIVLAACRCARLSLRYVVKGKKRPLAAIVAAEQWARKKIGLSEVLAAADAAGYAAGAAYAAAGAAYAAADAAAYAAAYAAADAVADAVSKA